MDNSRKEMGGKKERRKERVNGKKEKKYRKKERK